MEKLQIVAVSVAADTNNYGAALTASSGVAFTLAAGDPADGLAHKVIITPTGSVTGNYLISGLDADGHAISETLATNTTNAVTSVLYYVASGLVVKAPSGLGAETVSIGWTAASVSPSIKLLTKRPDTFNVGIGCYVASGSPTYSVQHSYDGVSWFTHSTITGKTADFEGSYTTPVAVIRMLFSAAGGVTLAALRAGNQ